jgi:hypothetical protein
LCTIKIRCTSCELLEVHIININIHFFAVNLENSNSSLLVGWWKFDFTI